MHRLVQILKNSKVLESDSLEKALVKIDRKKFVRPEHADFAYINESLAIGHDQTISQPYVVIFMLELLAVKPGQKILEVGYGSGWQTALLGELVGERGHVDAFEIIPELCAFGEQNLKKYPALLRRLTLHCSSAATSESVMDESRKSKNQFDRIISAAAVENPPSWWRESLKRGGTMVYPKKYSVWKETKNLDGSWTTEEYPGFIFVPFV